MAEARRILESRRRQARPPLRLIPTSRGRLPRQARTLRPTSHVLRPQHQRPIVFALLRRYRDAGDLDAADLLSALSGPERCKAKSSRRPGSHNRAPSPTHRHRKRPVHVPPVEINPRTDRRNARDRRRLFEHRDIRHHAGRLPGDVPRLGPARRLEARRLRTAGAELRASESPYLEFSDAVKKGLAQGEYRDLRTILTASGSAWQAAAWRLERRFPERWGSEKRRVAASWKRSSPP